VPTFFGGPSFYKLGAGVLARAESGESLAASFKCATVPHGDGSVDARISSPVVHALIPSTDLFSLIIPSLCVRRDRSFRIGGRRKEAPSPEPSHGDFSVFILIYATCADRS
jgi:hypothetical protein